MRACARPTENDWEEDDEAPVGEDLEARVELLEPLAGLVVWHTHDERDQGRARELKEYERKEHVHHDAVCLVTLQGHNGGIGGRVWGAACLGSGEQKQGTGYAALVMEWTWPYNVRGVSDKWRRGC